MNTSTRHSRSTSQTAVTDPLHDGALRSHKAQPEASAYFALSCAEANCDSNHKSLEELELPEFFAT